MEDNKGIAVDVAVGGSLADKSLDDLKQKMASMEGKMMDLFSKKQLEGQPEQPQNPVQPTNPTTTPPEVKPAEPEKKSDVPYGELLERLAAMEGKFVSYIEQQKIEKEKETLYKKMDQLQNMFESFTKEIKPEPKHTLPQRQGVPTGNEMVYWDGHKWVPKIEVQTKQ